MVAHTNAYFLFGGTNQAEQGAHKGQIARFDYVTMEWDLVGLLVASKRKRFNVIFDGSSFLIVGGAGENNLDTSNNDLETCIFLNDQYLKCAKLYSEVDWSRYVLPVLFMIGLDDGNFYVFC